LKVRLPVIRHDKAGFEALVHLYAQTKSQSLEDIQLDLTDASWIDADMCSALGAILYRLGSQANVVHLTHIPDRVETILSKNGFLSHYGRQRVPDTWGTTIPYRHFDSKDDHDFARYIEAELIHRREMPRMSTGLLKKFRESVFEIFSNAVIHSQTELGIFGCGQFFPKQHLLIFTIADLGISIRRRVKKSIGLDLSAEKAIVWATEGRNTTKRGRVPGGLGLKLLREFIQLNGGCIQIVSDAGYWKQQQGQLTTERLTHPFPGTVVSIEINTADTTSYALFSELSEEDIF